MSSNQNKRSIFASAIAETNPIVMQLKEMGFNNIYARRVFHYLHPEDLEEALNYMSTENRIIQHRFIKDRRNTSNIMCYICGESEEKHLRELNINNSTNSNNNQINLEDNKEQSERNDINTNQNNNLENSKTKSNFRSLLNSIRLYNVKSNNNKNNSNKEKGNNTKESMTVNIKNDKEEIECDVCNELFVPNEKNKVAKCGHTFCSGCWYDYLSVNIKENKLPLIKCLDYNCQEKLPDNFIINLLNSDKDLIKLYKRYKFELEIINDPNKKLCPYPNCDSYLEQKNKNNKKVTCKNNHTYCFLCLEKEHGNSPCKEKMDDSIKEFSKNHFVKRCPNCGIVIEKNNGCNHITCVQCNYEWCWLCNEKYNHDHFSSGKCKGFQFFQPKNDYEIKLMMEGKIKINDLAISQRQYDIDQDNINDNDNIIANNAEDYDQISICIKICRTIFFILFGNAFFIPTAFNITNNWFFRILYFLLMIALLFPLIYLNIIIFIILLLSIGFERFISLFNNLEHVYVKKFIIIIIESITLFSSFTYTLWEELINHTAFFHKFAMKLFIFFSIFISSIITYPFQLFRNVLIMIFILISDGFSIFIEQLFSMFHEAFHINYNSL